MEKRYYVNIDYEFQLFDPLYDKSLKKYSRYNQEFEHLFLWLEDEEKTLCSKVDYDPQYLNFIKEVRGVLPQISHAPGVIPWWGKLNDIDKMKFLNSKETSFQLGKQYDLNHHDCYFIDNKKSFEQLELKKGVRHIAKNIHSFSGMGNQIIDDKSELSFRGPFLIEPYLNITREYGLTVLGEDSFLVQTYQNEAGHFNGAYSSDFKEKDEIEETLEQVINYLKTFKLDESFEIDCFYYQDQGVEKFYPLVEINYRKTMTYFAAQLRSQLASNHGLWKLYKNRFRKQTFSEILDQVKELLYSREKGSGIIPVSPTSGQFFSFYFIQESKKKIEELVYDLERTLNIK